jgi:hypothetical protein
MKPFLNLMLISILSGNSSQSWARNHATLAKKVGPETAITSVECKSSSKLRYEITRICNGSECQIRIRLKEEAKRLGELGMSFGSIPDGKIEKNNRYWAVGNAKGNESEGKTLIKIELSNLGQNWQGLLLSTTSVAEGDGLPGSFYAFYSCIDQKLSLAWEHIGMELQVQPISPVSGQAADLLVSSSEEGVKLLRWQPKKAKFEPVNDSIYLSVVGAFSGRDEADDSIAQALKSCPALKDAKFFYGPDFPKTASDKMLVGFPTDTLEHAKQKFVKTAECKPPFTSRNVVQLR